MNKEKDAENNSVSEKQSNAKNASENIIEKQNNAKSTS
jgi:hypothetical protein